MNYYDCWVELTGYAFVPCFVGPGTCHCHNELGKHVAYAHSCGTARHPHASCAVSPGP